MPAAHRARELVGYLPWYFMMPSPDKDKVFAHLTGKESFDAPWGLTTAEQRHPRFLFEHTHDCLWNGYVWPFATAQTLTALANVLHACRDPGVSKDDYVRMLKTYARMHTLVNDSGEEQPWIDEVMHPYTGVWTCREARKQMSWPSASGGYERGKDYNHSTFCDLVLSGLIGITMEDGQVSADPLIPDDWDYFCVTHLTRDNWTILYDRTGERYGMGKGLHIFRA